MSPDARDEPRDRTPAGRYTVLVLCGVQFVDVLGVTVVITVLPRLLSDLGATTRAGGVLVTAYAMAFGGLLMVASRVGDRVGHRRVLVASLVVFGIAAALGARAGSIWVLVAARTLQGVAAAASVPAALRLLTTLTEPGEARRRAVAGWSAAGAAAGASGFALGGVLATVASWRAVFGVFVALAALLLLGVTTAVPASTTTTPTRIPWLSGLSLTAAAMGLVAGSSLLGETDVRLGAVLLAVGAACAVGFVVAERRARLPLVPAPAWGSGALRWGTFGSFVNTAGTSGSFTVAMLVLQDELGLDPVQAGGLLLAFSLLVVVGSAAATRLIAATAWTTVLAAGLGAIALGNAMLSAWPGVPGTAAAAAVCGLGIGLGSVAATDLGTQVEEGLRATAAGLLNTAAQLGTALGTATAVLLATTFDPSSAWAVTAVLVTLAAAVVVARRPRPDAH